LAVEGGTGFLFALLWHLYDNANALQLALATLFILFLIVILVIDLEHHRILNRLVYPGLALGLLTAPFVPHHYLLELLGGGLVGFGVLFLIASAYPGGMGMGDVKLAAFIGLMVGFPEILVALFLSFVAGGVAAASLMWGGLKGRRDPIPFGPFLAMGGIVFMLYGERIVTWAARF
jgi:leader peptidase (prepilin peptidase)/N-methyltransferase